MLLPCLFFKLFKTYQIYITHLYIKWTIILTLISQLIESKSSYQARHSLKTNRNAEYAYNKQTISYRFHATVKEILEKYI